MPIGKNPVLSYLKENSVKKILTVALIPTLLSVNAQAELNLRQLPGRQTITQTGGGRTDYCILPKQLPDFNYKKKKLEKDQELEAELCALDLYAADSGLAACPKLNSTNPGIKVFKLKKKAGGRAKWEKEECGKEDPDGPAKQIAKFKQTMTCSYAPSPLAYYHISRVLDAQPLVPVGVLRTMDARTHKEYVEKGGEYATAIYGRKEPDAPILKAWTVKWPQAHVDKPATLFDTSGAQVWGGLLDAPKGKENYKEMYTKPGEKFHYATRYEDFKSTTPYLKLKDKAPLANKLGKEFAKFAEAMVQLKDTADMILLDYLFNQQDRMGNIHYIPYYLYVKDGDIKDKKVKKAKEDDSDEEKAEVAAEEEEMKKAGAVVVKRMLLADNDCGVAKDNLMAQHKILEGVSHMGLETYRRLLWLKDQMKKDTWREFFMSELQFTKADLDGSRRFNGFQANLDNAVKILQKRCEEGNLNLDLNFQLQLEGKNITDSKAYCDLPADYKPGT